MLHKFVQPNILSICKQCVSRTNVHHHRRCISFIAKATPNPFAFKFEALEDIDDVFNKYLSFLHNASLPRQFSTPDLAANYSSLAKNILNVHGVDNIFFGDTYITLQIENNIDIEWEDVEKSVSVEMINFFETYNHESQIDLHIGDNHNIQKILSNEKKEGKVVQHSNIDLVNEIGNVIDEKVRPHVQADGGDVEFVIFDENGIVHLRMLGACVSCPSSTVTVRFMIKNMLQYYFDEVNDVKHVDWEEEEGED